MSDATLPPPRSSSEAPRTEGVSPPSSSSGERESSLSFGQPIGASGKDDVATDTNSRENKQKRKRTSPRDQSILEAEYKQNPKPNKAARAEIVEKVNLNEKEVQIWFQNRRQINRRKSRPLLPHEIAAFGLGGMAALSSDPASMVSFGSSQEDHGLSSQPEGSSNQEEFQNCQEFVDITGLDVAAERAEVPRRVEAVAEATPSPTLKQESSPNILPLESSSFSVQDSVIKSFSSNPGYLSNRWNTVSSAFSTPVSTQVFPLTTPPQSIKPQPASCPERINTSFSTPNSQMRLSLSLDGKAELISTIPSPPRQLAPRPTSSSGSIPLKRRRGLQRSFSAMPFGPRSSINQTNVPFVPRLPTGRSRDARNWELCADGEARDELTLQAENESHGSAVAAISLIRSSSNSALKPNSNKRNAQSLKQDSNKHSKRPKLGRATSSLARLQSPIEVFKPQKDLADYSKDGLMRSPSGDSDKENWLPQENGANPRRRPLPSSRSESKQSSKPVLGDNHNILSHATNFPGARNRKRKPANTAPEIFEDQENPRGGDEVEKFMRGEVSPSKKGDLDCIQGLLSLSQGNWR